MTGRVDPRGVVGLAALAFVTIGSYELARPAAESLFLKTYTSAGLPWAWLAVAATAGAVVSLYSRFSKGRHLLNVMGAVTVLCAGLVLALLLVARAGLPGAPFAMYVFKDVYIVVLIEIFWTVANVVYPLKTARWIYGLFCVAGSLGGVVMNLAAGWIAEHSSATITATLAGSVGEGAGTFVALWAMLPVLGVLAAGAFFGARKTAHLGDLAARAEAKAKPSYTEGLRLVANSRYLLAMLALIALAQLTINLIDYSFNQGIELYEPDTDARTKLIGQVYSSINFGAMILQLGTGAVLTWLGLGRALPGIPGLLGATMLAFVLFPHALLLAGAKAMSKILDYSLFRAAKELLYIPLPYEEKTQGKAVIDMLTYRAAKGLASVVVLGLLAVQAGPWVGALTVAATAAWLAVSLALVRMHRRRA